MTLASGTKLGPYEIVAPVGAGGMGEVYRARDTRLGRDVAIKVLPEAFAKDAILKERFEREAKTISSLNHPHICTLYDIGHQNGTDYLVMELLEGQSLAKRLERGALPVAETLRIGMEMSDALERAHRQGIVHRDLKPGNIVLTKSGAKLLDFGLAKPQRLTAGSGSALSGLATQAHPTSPVTREGTVIGTFQYMSPEQVEGKEADARSDIFALGAVLYEMATGKRAFEGKSQISIASAILEKEPEPISRVQPMTPPALEHVVRTCLAKHPDERYQSAHDIAAELRWLAGTAPEVSAPQAGRAKATRWLAVALSLGVVMGGVAVSFLQRAQPAQPVALAILPSAGVTFNFSGLYGPPAISPEGTRIVMTGTDSSGTRMLFLRSLRHTTPQPLAQTNGATYPFWSPDGRQIGFFANDRLKVVDAAGGSVLEVCSVVEGRGGTWNERGAIVYGTRTTGLFRVAATGGVPVVLTKLRAGEANHRFPGFFPDGDHVAYVVQTPGRAHAQVVSLSDPQPRDLADVISNVAFAKGRIFYVRDGALLAQQFDAKRLVLAKDRELVAKPVAYDGPFSYAAFAVSASGMVAYEEGSGSALNELVSLDRAGKQLRSLGAPEGSLQGGLGGLRISPQGDRLLYHSSSATRTDVWALQLASGVRTRISLGADGGVNGVWSPAGDQVVYQNDFAGDQLRVRASNGLGNERVLVKLNGEVIPQGWSAGGDYVVFEFHASAPTSPMEIWVAALKTGGEAPHPIVRNIMSWGTAVSPDGKWLAYTSDESGRAEVYVIPFQPKATPDNALASGRWQISTEGGSQPRWGRRGDELFFANTSLTTLYSTSIKARNGQLESSGVRKLFDVPPHPVWAFYDVSPDGNIYTVRYVGRQASPLTVLLNWRSAEE